jgi:hypothetical protein
MDALTPEEYASQSKLLQEFTTVPSIDSALILKTNNGIDSLFTLLPLSIIIIYFSQNSYQNGFYLKF